MELTKEQNERIADSVNANIKSFNMGIEEGRKIGYREAMLEMKRLLSPEPLPEPKDFQDDLCESCGGPAGQGNCFVCKMD